MEKLRLLVYGSLRRGQRAHARLGEDAEFIGQRRLSGYDMYHLGGWFPGIRENKENTEGVVVEEYLVNSQRLGDLDSFEGYFKAFPEHSLFLRDTVKVDGKDAYLYIFNGNLATLDARKISSGDWSVGICEND